MKVYRSKIDLWLMALAFGPFIYVIVTEVINANYEELYILAPILIFLIYMFASIRYVIDNEVLRVRAGFLVNQNIAISDIRSVHKTRNPLSAPALSINRLEVKYGRNYDYTLISPKNREEFVRQLLVINPDIDVKI